MERFEILAMPVNYYGEMSAELDVNEDENGDWVKWEDVKSLLEQLQNTSSNNKYTATQATPKSCKTCLHDNDRMRECDICLPDYTFYEKA